MEYKFYFHILSIYLCVCLCVYAYFCSSNFWKGILGNHQTIIFVSIFSPIIIILLGLLFVLNLIFDNDGRS